LTRKNNSYFGDDWTPPTDPDVARLEFQILLLEAGAEIRDHIPDEEDEL
jgi:hypothetical protein